MNVVSLFTEVGGFVIEKTVLVIVILACLAWIMLVIAGESSR